jgi:hypothetical protein
VNSFLKSFLNSFFIWIQVRAKRCAMFEAEARRQLNLIPRIEKIHVEYVGQPENATLILNKVSPEQFCRQVV